MIPQPSTTEDVTGPLPTQFNFDSDTCPSCGQAIPPDQLEEISGRIAAREREQASALTARLERQFAVDRAKADAQAKAVIELEKRQSAEREARAVEKAKSDAASEFNAKLEEAERLRQESRAADQKKLDEATAARQLAEAAVSSLQTQMLDLHQSSTAQIESIKKEGAQREAQIYAKANKDAEASVAERVAKLEADRQVSESALRQQIAQAEAAKSAAQVKETELSAQLITQRMDSDAEIAKVRAAAQTEAERIRQETVTAIMAQLHSTMAEKDKAVADAKAKTLEAEQNLQTLFEQQEQLLNERLTAQRDILDKDKETAINAEKSRAFEENQKLSTKVADLQRALDKKTNEELGEGAEIDLFESLRTEFPDDDVTRIAKGSAGADICHVVMFRAQPCGTIIYDSKNHKAFRSEHVTKLRADQLAAKAEHAILSLHKFPEGTRQLHQRDGVLLANPARVIALVGILRQQVVQVHTMRLSGIEREQKTAALYDFITSEQYNQLVRRMDERTNDLFQEQEKEVKWHEAHWKREGEAVRGIQKAQTEIDNMVAGILGSSSGESSLQEAS